jgi:HTH-like domain
LVAWRRWPGRMTAKASGSCAGGWPGWSGRWAVRRMSWRSRESLGGLGVSVRVARSRRLVAEGYPLATVARVLKVSRLAIYRVPTPRKAPQGRVAVGLVEQAIVAEATANLTDGYRMICAFVRRKLGIGVNRKRVLRVMREHKLIQPKRPLQRRKRPGFFRVERPRQLWQLDMTSVWVAEHGWCYLNAVIDCCTREIVAGSSSCAAAPTKRSPSSNAPSPCTGSSPARSRSAPTTARPSPPAASAPRSPSSASGIGAAATATPKARPSSKPGSGN